MVPVTERASTSRRGPRRSREAIRQLLIDAAVELVRRDGSILIGGLPTLTQVFDHLDTSRGITITYASVLGRVWASTEEFQTEVVATLARDDSTTEATETILKMIAVVESADRSNLTGRWKAIQDLSRVIGENSLNDLVNSATWPTWIGIWSTCAPTPNRPAPYETVLDALRESYENLAGNYTMVFEDILDSLGFRAKAPFDIRHLAVAVTSLAEGCALRDGFDPRTTRGIKRPTGPGGKLEKWTLFGIGIESLCHTMIEPVPRWKPPQ
jgi:hypothetical protein